MEFVAFVGRDKENWGQLMALINRLDDCEKIVLVMDKNLKDFPASEKCSILGVDCSKTLIELKEEMLENLKKEIAGEFEVELSLASGNGKEHMALIGALLGIPVGIKLVVFTKEGVRFVS